MKLVGLYFFGGLAIVAYGFVSAAVGGFGRTPPGEVVPVSVRENPGSYHPVYILPVSGGYGSGGGWSAGK